MTPTLERIVVLDWTKRRGPCILANPPYQHLPVEQSFYFLPVDGGLGIPAISVRILKEIVCRDIKLPVMLG